MIGKIKWFNNTKGFGFIQSADHHEDIFVQHGQIDYKGAINEGDLVQFDLEIGNRGSMAKNVKHQASKEEKAKLNHTHEETFEKLGNLVTYKDRLEREGRLGDYVIVPTNIKNYKFYFNLIEKEDKVAIYSFVKIADSCRLQGYILSSKDENFEGIWKELTSSGYKVLDERWID